MPGEKVYIIQIADIWLPRTKYYVVCAGMLCVYKLANVRGLQKAGNVRKVKFEIIMDSRFNFTIRQIYRAKRLGILLLFRKHPKE